MKHLPTIFLAFPLFAADGYFIVARTGAAATAIRNYIDAKADWLLAGTGAQNIAQPAYLFSDGTNQVTVRGLLHARLAFTDQPTGAGKVRPARPRAPRTVRMVPTTNGIVDVAALLASLPTPPAPKASQPLLVSNP